MLMKWKRKLKQKSNICIIVWKDDAWASIEELKTFISSEFGQIRMPSYREAKIAKNAGDDSKAAQILFATLFYGNHYIAGHYFTSVDTTLPKAEAKSYMEVLITREVQSRCDKVAEIISYQEFLDRYKK